MGYSTNFEGKLSFVGEVTAKQLQKLNTYLQEDIRDHKDWGAYGKYTYINYSLLKDFSGIEWDGSEKSYDMVETLNFVLEEMRKEYPGFSLEGQLNAQGEKIDDRWILAMENGIAVEKRVVITGKKIECPHCGDEFYIEEA